MRTVGEVDEAMRLSRQEREQVLLAQARGHGRALLLARAIYAVPVALLLVWGFVSYSPTALLVLLAMVLGFFASETVVDRRMEALLTLLELKSRVAASETATAPSAAP